MDALIRMETSKRIVLQKRSSKSILVWVSVAALSSLAVTAAATLSVIEWNFYGAGSIV